MTAISRCISGIVALALAAAAVGCGENSDDAGNAAAAGAAVTVAGKEVVQDRSLRKLLPEEVRRRDHLRVATDPPFPPFELYADAANTELTGFEPELARAMGALLGIELRFGRQRFDGTIPALQNGKFDLAMTAMTDTKERQEVLDFIDHSQSGQAIMIRNGNPEGISGLGDLCGKQVATVRGTTAETFIKAEVTKTCREDGAPPPQMKLYSAEADAQLAVSSGQVPAIVTDTAVAGYIAKTVDDGNTFEVAVDPSAPNGYGSFPNGIGVLKGRPELVKALQATLQRLMDDGVYAAVLSEFGMQRNALPRATVNAGR